MSFSVSNLLNPSSQGDAQTSPPVQGIETPATARLQSQEQHHRSAGDLEGLGTQPSGAAAGAGDGLEDRAQAPSSSSERGSSAARGGIKSSGYNESVQLSAPSARDRKMSSPAVERLNMSPRANERRTSSMGSPQRSEFILAPLQGLSAPESRSAITEEPNQAALHSFAAGESRSAHAQNSPVAGERGTDDHCDVRNTAQTSTASIPESAQPLEELPAIKQEAAGTPRDSSPAVAPRAAADVEGQGLKSVSSLKNEQSTRTLSPLRESSIPIPSTETAAMAPTNPKKRSAPLKKKGTATTSKKAPAPKKRKLDTKRDTTPSSRASKPPNTKAASSKGTPLNSSPVASTRSQSDEEEVDEDEEMDDDEARENDGDLYCVCRRPDTGTFMIGCDGPCDDWYHGKCVGVEEKNKHLVETYICPRCTEAGIGTTLWKRICRRKGCRQPARSGKGKGGKDRSKYCSEECGVLYFREMVGRTRGREETARNRSSRKRASADSNPLPLDNDLGARGGILAAGEVKRLLDPAQSSTDFRKLGTGVLSPPKTPTIPKDAAYGPKQTSFTPSESAALQRIAEQKDAARQKHQLLKDRTKFVNMAKQAATHAASDKDLKPRDFCGYDTRLEWTDVQFAAWRNSGAGKRAFELDTLADEGANEDDMGVDVELLGETEVCERKKCARHHEWGKLAVDDVRFEMSDNGDRMRGLDREEKVLREGVALRGKTGAVEGDEGTVVMHEAATADVAVTNGVEGVGEEVMAMEVDGAEA